MTQWFNSFEELNSEALKSSKNAPKKLQYSTYLYFIARFFGAMYEAIYLEIPIQVWNEYRNALDHFFRYLSTPVKNQHLNKMEGHLLRSVLDITKLIYYKSKERLDDDWKEFKNDKTVRELAAQSESYFMEARQKDVSLVGDGEKDAEIIELYIRSAFLFIEVYLYIIKKNKKPGDSEKASIKALSLK